MQTSFPIISNMGFLADLLGYNPDEDDQEDTSSLKKKLHKEEAEKHDWKRSSKVWEGAYNREKDKEKSK